MQWEYVAALLLSCRYEAAASGPMDRDWRHYEGCDPAGGGAGSYCRRSGKFTELHQN